jgi:hypothetical protein
MKARIALAAFSMILPIFNPRANAYRSQADVLKKSMK